MGAMVVFVFVLLLSLLGSLCMIPAIFLLVKKNGKKIHKIFSGFLFSLSVLCILPVVFVIAMVSFQIFVSVVYDPIMQRYSDGELVTSIKKNNYIRTKALLEKGMPVNVIGTDRYSPLAVACQYGDEQLVELLIDSGANINEKFNEDQTPLYIATMHSKPETVRLLISKKADVDAYTSGSFSCLMDAAINGDYDIADQLVTAGIDVNVHNSRRNTDEGSDAGATALMYAASSGKPDALRLVELLLRSGADVNAVDARGRTALVYACTRYPIEINPAIVRLLLDNGAEVGLKDISGKNALEHILGKIEAQKTIMTEYDNDYQKGLLRDYETIRDWLEN